MCRAAGGCFVTPNGSRPLLGRPDETWFGYPVVRGALKSRSEDWGEGIRNEVQSIKVCLADDA
ncbi:unannotated protein [freshwater metagenome]|uniref:Unannotated protein n=1 Tax=freshwater metagenome TaxID=449393 RepID=A0A6J7I4L4_9ZZZZ